MEPSPSADRCLKKDLVAGLFVLLASTAVFVAVNRPWEQPARLPRAYTGDYVVYLAWVETMIEEGSYLNNSRAGRPLGTDWRGFPTSDGWLNWQVIRALTLVNPEPAWAMNWFYWLTYPMVGLSSFAAARLLGLSRLLSVSVGLLFDFMPYHLMRSEHVFMTAYYLVPWSLYACLQWRTVNTAIGRWNRPTSVFFAMAVLTGLGYVYYACFACILMLTAGIARSLNDRRWRPLVCSTLWCGMVMATLTATMLPEIRHKMAGSPNPDVSMRNPGDAEKFGLKITQLLLPVPDHQLGMLARLRAEYQILTPLVNENDSASLGLIGSAGFLFLLFRLVFRRPASDENPEDLLSLLALAIVLLATIGGFSSLINWVQHFTGMKPWIRSYNRISVFLGFIVLVALAQVADRRWRTLATARARVLFAVLTLAITAWGIFDQTPRNTTMKHAGNAALFESDEDYFPKLEAMGSPGDYVFMLGYRYYPECSIEPLTDYSHYRPYLHAKKLTFSYGALRGEANDLWCRELSSRPTSEIIGHLARMEAFGLLVFRPSLEDEGKQIEATAEAILGEKPIVSRDGQFAFFNLRARSNRLKADTPAAEWSAVKERLRHPLVPVWRKGFLADQSLQDLSKMVRHFGTESEIRVVNGLDIPRRLELSFTVTATHADDAAEIRWLRISQGELSEVAPVAPKGTDNIRTLTLPPGETVLRLMPCLTREAAESGYPTAPCWMAMSKISWAEK